MAGELLVGQGGTSSASAAAARTALGILGTCNVTRGQATRAAATATGTVDVAHGLGVVPKLVLFFAVDTAPAAGNNSIGYSYGAASCACLKSALGVTALDAANAISVLQGGDGQSATVSAVDTTNFTLSWVKAVGGKAVAADWLAFG